MAIKWPRRAKTALCGYSEHRSSLEDSVETLAVRHGAFALPAALLPSGFAKPVPVRRGRTHRRTSLRQCRCPVHSSGNMYAPFRKYVPFFPGVRSRPVPYAERRYCMLRQSIARSGFVLVWTKRRHSRSSFCHAASWAARIDSSTVAGVGARQQRRLAVRAEDARRAHSPCSRRPQ